MKIEDLEKAIELAHVTKVLDLARELLDIQNLERLIEAIPTIEGLLVFAISELDIPANLMRPLASAVRKCTSLRHLELSSCEINHDMAETLFNGLQDHPSLWSLQLMFNPLIDEENYEDSFNSIEALVKLLKYNKVLLEIDLFANRIGYTGGRIIAAALKNNSSLLKLAISESLGKSLIGISTEDEINSKLEENARRFINQNIELRIPNELIKYLKAIPTCSREITLKNAPVLYISSLQEKSIEDVAEPLILSNSGFNKKQKLSAEKENKKTQGEGSTMVRKAHYF